jgi:hypothetical protein
MKLTLKLAVGAALTIASLGAFAQVAVPTPPYTNLNLPTSNNGSATLTLFSTNDGTPFSYSFNLGLNFNDLLASNGMNTPGTTLTWSLTGLATDLTGYTAASSLVFDVSAGGQHGSVNTTAGAVKLLTTMDPTVTVATILTETNQSLLSAVTQGVHYLGAGIGSTGTLNAATTGYTGTSNPYFTTTVTDPGYANANYGQGYNQLFVNTAASVATALPFYELITAKGATGTLASAVAEAGTWAINLTNDTLTYSVPANTAVPLPASIWLLLSGLAGATVLGRRGKALQVSDAGTLAV